MYSTLISPSQLAGLMAARNLAVFDCRHNLADPGEGRRLYAEAHLPNAHFLHMDEDLSSPCTGTNGRHPLPDPQRLAARLAACGVSSDSQIVVYDDGPGMMAARLWWLARWLGHDAVAVLDGGLAAWQRAGFPLERAVQTPPTGDFRARLRPEMVVDAEYVLRHLDDPAVYILDARAADRFRGENETLDPVGGHIPGAHNRFFRLNLQEDNTFLPPDALRGQFAALLGDVPPEAVVHQCGSGVTACHNQLAMMHAGLPPGRLYAGSWSEWCADPARPVATGDDDGSILSLAFPG